jgi:ubiquinone biosynthesis monooxygenase Coq7
VVRNPCDRLIGEIDHARWILAHGFTPGHRQGRPLAWQRRSIRLLRVNHAGEVAAQALYRAQALAARADPPLARQLVRAGEEERRHLLWCENRLAALGGRPSRLNPAWYGLAFLSGLLAGTLGRGISLGYIAETEAQVESHLTDHLRQLPAEDGDSRRILDRMREEEAAHGAWALKAGGRTLPQPVRRLMHWTSRALVYGSYLF